MDDAEADMQKVSEEGFDDGIYKKILGL